MVYPKKKGKSSSDSAGASSSKQQDKIDDKDQTTIDQGTTKGKTPSKSKGSKPPGPKNTSVNPKFAQPPTPQNLSKSPSEMKNDPLATDYMIGAEETVMMPIRMLRRLPIEFSSYPALVESVHRALTAQSSHYAKTVPPSAFAMYAYWHLQYRLIAIKTARNEILDADEEAFKTAFASTEKLLPKPLANYLAGIGHFTVRERESYWVLPRVNTNADGHFGQIDADTAIDYATCPAALVALARLVAELNAPAHPPNNGAWPLPAAIAPQAPAAGAAEPTINLLGYYPLQGLRQEAKNHFLPLISQANDPANVVSQTRFLYVPALAADIAEQVATCSGPNENPLALPSSGSVICGVQRVHAEPLYRIQGQQTLLQVSFAVRSAELLPTPLASAAMMFGYRTRRAHIPHHRDSPVMFPPQHWPQNWMANKDHWLNDDAAANFQPGSRNNQSFTTASSEPATSITRWVAARMQKTA